MYRRAICLVILQTLFLGRVLGQILAELKAPPWLPAVEYWHSGLLPYAVLLPVQILILMFMSLVTYDAFRQSGFWDVRMPRTKRILRRVTYLYMAAMALRYVLTMALVPELRWFGHSIPIVFHFVLASYILILGLGKTDNGVGSGYDEVRPYGREDRDYSEDENSERATILVAG